MKKIVFRIAADAFLAISLFFLPWFAVFSAAVLMAAIFSWYVEMIGAGFLAAALAGLPFWKPFVILGAVVAVEERLKTELKIDGWRHILWLWIFGIFSLTALFFIFV